MRSGNRAYVRVASVIIIAALTSSMTAQDAATAPAAESLSRRDGERDFDWEIGTWNTHLRRLTNPLSGSTEWVEYTGTSKVIPLLGGKANLVELDVEGPSGRIQGMNLRLYDPQSQRWSLYYASSRGSTIYPPVIGSFENGRGVFHGMEMQDGQPIYVRFVISVITPDSAEFEQAFSPDGGKTWEVNWLAVDTRIPNSK